MSRYATIFLVICSWCISATAQPDGKLYYKGQLSGWVQYAPDQSYDWLLGGRYIPEIDYAKSLHSGTQTLSLHASLNIYGTTAIASVDSTNSDGKIKPYRIYAEWAFKYFTLKGGLQEIRLGSAQMFRSVAWFDRTDPRDPLRISDGVWGLTGRYYFPGTKLNLWMWFLYGNKDAKGTDFIPTNQSIPEMGGRLQWRYPLGNIGLSYHFRRANTEDMDIQYAWVPEHRFGLDAKFNWRVGVSVEATNINLAEDIDMYTQQSMATLGLDYTFRLGKGLKTVFEQFVSSLNKQTFVFENSVTFSGLSLSYPVTESNDLNYMFYYDWTNQKYYNYARWSHRFKHLTLHAGVFWNPTVYAFDRIETLAREHMLGKGVQLMLVWNH